MTCTDEYGQLSRVMLLDARGLFESEDRIAREWRALNFTARPDGPRAIAEFDAFAAALSAAGARIDACPAAADVTLDAVYVRDASIVTPRGIVLARMGKPTRQTEPEAQRRAFDALGVPVLGAIEAPGQLEGGDLVWFDERTVAVGHGYRTNGSGIAQLKRWLGDAVHVEVVALPHYRGPSDVFHLMSILSPVDRDLAVVYSPLMPVPFRCWLLERGIELVEVPEVEFDSMGTNVLAVGPRRVVMLAGNPSTRAGLETAGAEVWTYEGAEISVKGGGGPTCLTRPLERLASAGLSDARR